MDAIAAHNYSCIYPPSAVDRRAVGLDLARECLLAIEIALRKEARR